MNRVLFSAGLLLGLASTALGQAERAAVLVTSELSGQNDLAVTGRGDFIVAWTSIDDRSSSRGVFVRLLDADGTPNGSAFRAHEQIFGDQQYPSVAADQAGNFVVAWQGGKGLAGTNAWPGGDGDRTGVYVQRFDRAGRRVGRQIQVNRRTQGYQLYPKVAMARTGSFIVAWIDCPQTSEHCWIWAQPFSAAGLRKGEPVSMPVGDSIYSETAFVTADPRGSAVGWTEYTDLGHRYIETYPVVQRLGPSGRPAAEHFRLSDGRLDGTGWHLAGLASGGTDVGSVAVFNGLRNSFQLFGSDGRPSGPRTIVGRRDPCSERHSSCESVIGVVMNGAGDFAVIWSMDGAEKHAMAAQLFDPQGLPRGDRFELEQTQRQTYDLSAVLTDDGTLAYLTGPQSPGQEDGLYLRLVPLD